MCNTLNALYAALQPVTPYYFVSYTQGEATASISVFTPGVDDESHQCDVTTSVAVTLLMGARHYNLNGVECEVDAMREALEAGEAAPALRYPLARQLLSDALQAYHAAGKVSGCVEGDWECMVDELRMEGWLNEYEFRKAMVR